ncbi:MAG: replication initiation factor domain-containing protein [Dehalococcoidales bacterium]
MRKNDSTESSVDWVTATSLDQRTGAAWMEAWQKHKENSKGRVEKIKMHGFLGLRVENLTWSIRDEDQRFMMVASGAVAKKLWADVNTAHAKITRVDLCVDCWLPIPRPGLAREIYRVLSSPAWDASVNKFSLYQSATKNKAGRKGETLYCGSRATTQMGRMYDKGQETQEVAPGAWWRYEVEYKAERAQQIARSLKAHPKERIIRATVGGWFRERFIGTLFSAGENEAVHTSTYAVKSTAEKRLAWLRSQVRPTVAYLFDVGLGREAVGALGLENRLPQTAVEKSPSDTIEYQEKDRMET